MKILLSVDGSACTQRMLAYLGAHDELLAPQHEFIVLTVVAPIPDHAAKYVTSAMLQTYEREEGDRVLHAVRAYAKQQGWNVEFVVRTGHAGHEIARFADECGCDLVVMGSHGHSSLSNVLLGSVATRVLAECKKPVLLVR